MKTMKTWLGGKVPGNFIEVMACEGGCISGPGTICPSAVAEKRVAEFAREVLSASA